MFSKTDAVLQGTIELLVLKRLSHGPMHGYGIASWIETATDDVLRVEEGSLYPALYRMVQKRWIKGEWGISENNRRAKFYRLTKAGDWLRLTHTVSRAVTSTDLPTTEGIPARIETHQKRRSVYDCAAAEQRSPAQAPRARRNPADRRKNA